MGLHLEQKKYIDKDPKRLFLYLFDNAIDRADDTFKTSKCEVCTRSLNHFTTRACVICKRPTCKLCACKYWIPGERIEKEKDTLQAICLICRDQLLLFKQEKTGIPANLRPYRNFQKGEAGRIAFLPPSLWAPKRLRGNCFECGRAYKNARSVHNCRVCGEIVGNRCSVRMDLPRGFERKLDKEKQKKRVCLDCRYYIISGIELKEAEPKPFSSFEIENEWANKIELDNMTIKKNTLFPTELSITLENKRTYPEMPEYKINAVSNSFRSPLVCIEKNITNFIVNGEDNQKVVVVMRVEMDYRPDMKKLNKKHDELIPSSAVGNFGKVSVMESNEEEDGVFSELVNVLSRKSTRGKLRKVETRVGELPDREENELEKAIRKRFEALGDEFIDENESVEEDWQKK